MIKKAFLQTGRQPVVRVTFALSGEAATNSIFVVGDFNNWNRTSTPMRRERDGRWVATVDMAEGRAYQFRYLCDGEWLVDDQADAYTYGRQGSRNALVVTDPDFG